MRYVNDSSSHERGSVFIIALLVLVILSFIGLSLVLVTETEMLIGGNEQLTNETFFASEAGIAAAVAQLMVANALQCQDFIFLANDEDAVRRAGIDKIGYVVDTTASYPVMRDEAAYTKANEGRDDKLFAGFFRTQIRAQRLGWPEDEDLPEGYCGNARANIGSATDVDGDGIVDLSNVQSEQVIDLAFYVAPVSEPQGLDLFTSFGFPDVLCADKAKVQTCDNQGGIEERI